MSRPWMPLYVADYLADTGHLSAAESGAYLHLIMHYWSNGQLPNDDKKLARIARMERDEWAEARETIYEFFNPGWKHPRIEKELAEANAAYERRAAAGRKGGLSNSKLKEEQCVSNEEALLEHCLSDEKALLKQSQSQPQSQLHKKIGGEARKRASRLPQDWTLPDDYREAARQRGLADAEINRQADRMRNWSLSATGGAKLDWFRTWLNWIDSAPKNVTPIPARSSAFQLSKPAANF